MACPAAMRVTEMPGAPSPWGKPFSEKKATARALDCPVKELEISESNKGGGKHTWTAFCGSKEYRCRRDDGGTSCEAEAKPPVYVNPEQPRTTVRSMRQPSAPLEAPLGEFAFGDSLDDAKSKCEHDSKTWSSEGQAHSCSEAGAAPGRGVYLRFCASGLCTIEERSRPHGTSSTEWISAFKERQRSLEAAYGPPNREELTLPPKCRKVLVACLENGTARMRYLWLWDNGERLELSLDQTAGPLAVRVLYRRPARSAAP